MIVPEWVPPIAVTIAFQVVLFFYFAGGMKTRLEILQGQVDKLVESQAAAQIAVLESRVNGHDGLIEHNRRSVEEVLRTVSKLTMGVRAHPMHTIENGD